MQPMDVMKRGETGAKALDAVGVGQARDP